MGTEATRLPVCVCVCVQVSPLFPPTPRHLPCILMANLMKPSRPLPGLTGTRGGTRGRLKRYERKAPRLGSGPVCRREAPQAHSEQPGVGFWGRASSGHSGDPKGTGPGGSFPADADCAGEAWLGFPERAALRWVCSVSQHPQLGSRARGFLPERGG